MGSPALFANHDGPDPISRDLARVKLGERDRLEIAIDRKSHIAADPRGDGAGVAARRPLLALRRGKRSLSWWWEGSAENATLVGMLLADLVDRGPDPERAGLFVVGGGSTAGVRIPLGLSV